MSLRERAIDEARNRWAREQDESMEREARQFLDHLQCSNPSAHPVEVVTPDSYFEYDGYQFRCKQSSERWNRPWQVLMRCRCGSSEKWVTIYGDAISRRAVIVELGELIESPPLRLCCVRSYLKGKLTGQWRGWQAALPVPADAGTGSAVLPVPVGGAEHG